MQARRMRILDDSDSTFSSTILKIMEQLTKKSEEREEYISQSGLRHFMSFGSEFTDLSIVHEPRDERPPFPDSAEALKANISIVNMFVKKMVNDLDQEKLLDNETKNSLERLLDVQIDPRVFSPLLLGIRTSEPALYNGVLGHDVMKGQIDPAQFFAPSFKKKRFREGKESLKSRSDFGATENDQDSDSSTSSPFSARKNMKKVMPNLDADPLQTQALGRQATIFIGKTLVEGSLQAHLISIKLLLSTFWSIDKPHMHGEVSDECRSGKHTARLPLGALLGTLFTEDKAVNPFYHVLLLARKCGKTDEGISADPTTTEEPETVENLSSTLEASGIIDDTVEQQLSMADEDVFSEIMQLSSAEVETYPPESPAYSPTEQKPDSSKPSNPPEFGSAEAILSLQEFFPHDFSLDVDDYFEESVYDPVDEEVNETQVLGMVSVESIVLALLAYSDQRCSRSNPPPLSVQSHPLTFLLLNSILKQLSSGRKACALLAAELSTVEEDPVAMNDGDIEENRKWPRGYFAHKVWRRGLFFAAASASVLRILSSNFKHLSSSKSSTMMKNMIQVAVSESPPQKPLSFILFCTLDDSIKFEWHRIASRTPSEEASEGKIRKLCENLNNIVRVNAIEAWTAGAPFFYPTLEELVAALLCFLREYASAQYKLLQLEALCNKMIKSGSFYELIRNLVDIEDVEEESVWTEVKNRAKYQTLLLSVLYLVLQVVTEANIPSVTHLLAYVQKIMCTTIIEASFGTKRGKGGGPELDENRMSSNMELIDGNRGVIQRQSKNWGCVMAREGFSPGSGIHQWAVSLDRCEKGHVFIGVCTAQASINTYVGGDRHGWGLIGTRTLWHNRSKARSDYGCGFFTGSVVYVTLDSDRGVLSFSSAVNSDGGGGDWGIAFDEIPQNEPLYPAIGLYQRDDQVSIFAFPSQKQKGLSSTGSTETGLPVSPCIYGMQASAQFHFFLKYSKELLLASLKKLEISSESGDFSTIHPLLSSFLPRLLSALLLISPGFPLEGFLAIQLLPTLSKMVDLCNSIISKAPSEFWSASRTDLTGKWQINSKASGSISAQNYVLSLKKETEDNASTAYSYGVVGEGSSKATSVAIKGTVLGLRVLFTEIWFNSGSCVVDAHLSPDGCFFEGVYYDRTSGTKGDISGLRKTPSSCASPLLNYSMLSSLVASAIGKYAAVFVAGVPAKLQESSIYVDPEENSDELLAYMGTFDNFDIVLNETEEGNEVEENAAAQSTPDVDTEDMEIEVSAPSDSTGIPVHDGTNEAQNLLNPATTVSELQQIISEWCCSPLLNGGLAYGEMQKHISSTISFYSSVKNRTEIDQSWLNSTFGYDVTNPSSSKPILYSFYEEIIAPEADCASFGMKVDLWAMKHGGSSFFLKLGGNEMEIARRNVIAALVLHTNSLPQILSAWSSLAPEETEPSFPPDSSILDIWKTARQVIETGIRSARSAGTDVAVTASIILHKAEFLLDVQPGYWYFDGDRHQKVLSMALSFLQSRLHGTGALRAALSRASVLAACRTAGLFTLTNILEGSSTNNKLLPLSTLAMLQQAAPTLQGRLHLKQSEGSPNARALVMMRGGTAGCHSKGLEGASISMRNQVYGVFISLSTELVTRLRKAADDGDSESIIVILQVLAAELCRADQVFLAKVGFCGALQQSLDCVLSAAFKIGPTDDAGRFSNFLRYERRNRVMVVILDIMNLFVIQVLISAPTEGDLTFGTATNRDSMLELLFNAMTYFFDEIRRLESTDSIAMINISDVRPVKEDKMPSPNEYCTTVLQTLLIACNADHCVQVMSSVKWLDLLFRMLRCTLVALDLQRLILRLLRIVMPGVDPLETHLDCSFSNCSSDAMEVLDQPPAIGPSFISSMLDFLGAFLLPPSLVDTLAADNASKADSFSDSFVSPSRNIKRNSDMKIIGRTFGNAVAAEIVVLLRTLYLQGKWRTIMNEQLLCAIDCSRYLMNLPLIDSQKFLSRSSIDESKDSENREVCISNFKTVIAAISVLGGYMEDFYVEGPVVLNAKATNEHYSTRLSSPGYGIVKSLDPSKETATVKLLERPSQNSRNVIKNGGDSSILKTMHQAKMAFQDLTPMLEEDAPIESFTVGLASALMASFMDHCLPWMCQGDNGIVQENIKNNPEPVSEPALVSNDGVDIEMSNAATPLESRMSSDEVVECIGLCEVSALQALLAAQLFRSVDAMLTCPKWSSHFFYEIPIKEGTQNWLPRLLRAAVDAPISRLTIGRLGEKEQNLTKLWSKWHLECDLLVQRAIAPNSDTSPPATPSIELLKNKERGDERIVPSARMEREREESSINVNINASNLAEYISATAAALGAGTVVLDTSAAVAQLMEMGFAKEWCEVALRRCGNSMELAVNFCFEHAADMPRLIEEESAAVRAVEQRRAGLLRRVQSVAESSSAGMPRQSSDSTGQFMRQLLEMGFPPGWCSRALAANRNNVDAALTWILSNGARIDHENHEEEQSTPSTETKPVTAKISKEPTEGPSADLPLNPLRLVSGQAKISDELGVEGVPAGGFASVGARGCPVTRGKWYYEATLGTGGCMQLGWADVAYQGNAESGDGVGDGPHSWAYDGWRCYRWHGKYAQWGARWAAGDVVGCWADLQEDAESKLGFLLNGLGEEINMGTAFSGFRCAGGLYPCASFNRKERLIFNFGGQPFKHALPPGFRPYIEAINEKISHFIKVAALADSHGYSKVNVSYLEDNLEEELDTSTFTASTRYFAPDSTSNNTLLVSSEESSDNHEWKNANARIPALRRLRMLQRSSPRPDPEGSADGGSSLDVKPSETSQAPAVNETWVPTEVELEAIENTRENIVQCSIEMCALLTRRTVGLLLARWPRSDSLCFTVNKLVSDLSLQESSDKRAVFSDASNMFIRILLLICSRSQLEIDAGGNGANMWGSFFSHLGDLDEKCPTIRQAISSLGHGGIGSLKSLEPTISSAIAASRIAAENNGPESELLYRLVSFVGCQILECTHISRSGLNSTTDISVSRRLPTSTNSGSSVTDDLWGSSFDKPNMTLVVWITSRLLADPNAAMMTFMPSNEDYGVIAERLLFFWSQGLYSPNMTFKLLAIGMVSSIMRDMFAGKWGGEGYEISRCIDMLPTKRLEHMALARIWTERGSHPICSRYVQGLVDLSCSIYLIDGSQKAEKRKITDSKIQSSVPLPLPPPDISFSSSSDYCHEWDKGTILSDNGWTVFSGTVKQDEFEWPKPNRNRSLLAEAVGDEAPHLLRPGCHVTKGPNWDEGGYPEPRPSPESVARAQAAAEIAAAIPKPPPLPPPVKSRSSKGPKLWGRTRGVPRTTAIDNMEEEVLAAMAAMAAMESDGDESQRHDSDEPAMEENMTSRQEGVVGRSPFSTEYEECASSTDEDGINDDMDEACDNEGGNGAQKPSSDGSKAAETPAVIIPPVHVPEVSPPAIGVVEEIIDWDGIPGQGRRVRWPDGSVGDYRWGAGGRLDLVHVDLNPDGSIRCRYPLPETREDAAITAGLGKEIVYGVILRLRPAPHTSKANEISHEVEGILEWPDLDSAVRVTGHVFADGTYRLTEREILWGSHDAGWICRFGTHEWQPNTTFSLQSTSWATEDGEHVRSMVGVGSYDVNIGGKSCTVKSHMSLQADFLFTLDTQRCAPNITISGHGRTARCTSNDGRCAVYGSIGFSQGIHYWEVKIQQAEPGCVFLGVAEAPSKGRPVDTRIARWPGKGFVNYRATFYSGSERVYGEHFHSHDVVGVLLDMDRGTISFFLDGMKYGEHVVANLGVAFDGLHGPRSRVIPTVFYPVVGLRKKDDCVSLTSKWISSPGLHPTMLIDSARKAAEALQIWENRSCLMQNQEYSVSQPTKFPDWLITESWQHCRRWRSNRWRRVTTRAGNNARIDLDCSPSSCLVASMNLGLVFPIFPGDTVQVHHSNGRALESPEALIVLGAYMGRLWWRRADGPKGGGGGGGEPVGDAGVSAAWCWSYGDIDSDEVETIRTSPISPLFSRTIPLAKMCLQPNLRLEVCNAKGAAFFPAVEFDTADQIGLIPVHVVLEPRLIRVSKSGDIRYFVTYFGIKGWISEYDPEDGDLNVQRIPAPDGDDDMVPFPSGCSDSVVEETVKTWEDYIINAGGYEGKLWLQNEDALDMECDSDEEGLEMPFDEFVHYATDREWTVEEDMQVAELLNEISNKLGEEQANMPWYDVKGKLYYTSNSSPSNTANNRFKDLCSIPMLQIMARMCIIRTFNTHMLTALPYFRLTLPEEDWWHRGCSSNLRLPQPDAVEDNGSKGIYRSWKPICIARGIRQLRRLLLTETKRTFWEGILAATASPTPLPHDEYEDPREVRLVRLNRVRAAFTRLAQIKNPVERLRNSLFGQLQREMRSWPASAFRRSFIGKGQGGQRRAFRVKFLGEGVNDYGGPYRAVFEQVSEELQGDQVKGAEGCLLPLLVPVPNRTAKVGLNQDKFTLHPSFRDSHDLMNFFGRILGTSVRHGLQMGLDLPSTLWRPLVGLPLKFKHLEEIDFLTARRILEVRRGGEMVMNDNSRASPEVWSELTLTKHLSDGRLVELIPGGATQTVSRHNWKMYTSLTTAAGLHEGGPALNALFAGLTAVLPTEILPIFTADELETMVCGSMDVDIDRLEEVAEYEDVEWGAPHIQDFWKVLRQDFTPPERAALLRFVWARSRLPKSIRDFPMSFRIQAATGGARERPDDYLPHAQTCFFTLSLPSYSSREILCEKLKYAIANCPTMDADVRLHNAEGW